MKSESLEHPSPRPAPARFCGCKVLVGSHFDGTGRAVGTEGKRGRGQENQLLPDRKLGRDGRGKEDLKRHF